MASETDLANLALGRIGANRLNNISENTPNAIECRTHYATTRDALLRMSAWAFAKTTAVLSLNAVPPVGCKWKSAFSLPPDYLRLVDEKPRDYEIAGQQLLSNSQHATIEYVRRVTDPNQFDALFTEVLVLKLAVALVMPLSNDKVLRQAVGQEYEAALVRARVVDAQDEEEHRGPSWLESRRFNTSWMRR